MKGPEAMIRRTLQDRFLKFYYTLYNGIEKAFGAVIEASGLTIQKFRILVAVYEQEVPTLSELSQALGMNKGNCSTLCKKLVKENLLRRSRRDSDERCIELRLTEQGTEKLAEIQNVLSQIQRSFQQNKSVRELNDLYHNMDYIENMLRELQQCTHKYRETGCCLI